MGMPSVSGVLRKLPGHRRYEWDIENFLDLPQGHGEYLQSPSFLLGDTSFNLQIFPKGDSPGECIGWVSLYLHCIDQTRERTFSCTMALKSGRTSLVHRNVQLTFKIGCETCGKRQFIRRSAIYEIASLDGLVTVQFSCSCLLDGRMRDDATQTSRTEVSGIEILPENLKYLCLGDRRTDVKLKVQGREFHAHTSILGARSPVFNAMFNVEVEENNCRIVEIPDMDPESFRYFLQFMYTGNFDLLTPRNALDFYRAADKYTVTGIKTECSLRMASWLAVDNVLDVLRLADTHGEEVLLKRAADYFVEHAKEIFATEKWKVFTVEKASFANELLKKMANKV